MIRASIAIIERVRRLGPGWQQVSLAVDDTALTHIQPGQSLLVRTHDTWEPYLRDVWVPIAVDQTHAVIEIERPDSESYTPGADIHVLGPIGTPYLFRDSTKNLLLVAQDFPPTRLRFLLNVALQTDRAVTLVLTGDAKEYPTSVLPPAVEIIYSDDTQTWPAQKDTLLWADQVFVVAPAPFYDRYFANLQRTAIDIRHALPEGYLNAVFDLPIPCGTGACMACMVSPSEYACLHGPAFDLAKMRF